MQRGSTKNQVPALRPPALLGAPGLAPGAARRHEAPNARAGPWRREAARGSQPSPQRQWRALALHPTWAGARPMASTQKVVEPYNVSAWTPILFRGTLKP